MKTFLKLNLKKLVILLTVVFLVITSSITVFAGTQLLKWDLDVGGDDSDGSGPGDIVYTSKFNVTSNKVTLNFRQWAYNDVDQTARIEYAIVKKGFWYGNDDVLASVTVETNNSDSPKKLTLDCGSASDVRLRITCKTDTGSMMHSNLAHTFGEVYNGD